MIGTEIQLIHTMASDGKLIYELRLVNYEGTAEQYGVDAPSIKRQMLEAACANSATREQLLGRGIALQFNVGSKGGGPLAAFEIHPADCGL